MYHQVFISGPPCVRLQSVLDHQFRIEFPSTGKKRDPSIPGARIVKVQHKNTESFGTLKKLRINHTRVYDPRDDYEYPIVNFPWLSGDVPRLPSYGIYILQLVRISFQKYVF